MRSQKEKMPLKKRIVLAFTVLVLSSIVGILCAAILSTPTDSPDNNTENTNVANEPQKVLFEDENYRVIYQKFVDPNMGVTTFNLYLKIENKTDKEINVMLEDGYANDTSVLFMTGLPVNIAPGKNAVGGFLFGYANLGFESIEDVKKLEFKISFRDKETYDELFKTDTIQLDF